ncbi:MAG: inosine/xanthosine triphosphatase [Chloroflexota bacterium]
MTDIIVASGNPVKVNATRAGFTQMFPDEPLTVTGQAYPSGVAAQPMGDEETRAGALNRAQAARTAHPAAAYTVGIEGGCTLHPDDGMSVYAWVVVLNHTGQMGHSKTGTFYLPREVADLVRGGMELGDADDIVFGRSNSKQQTGSVGLLTGDVLTRETYYLHAVVLALIPFKNPAFTFPPA